jgi:hypothetical protein
MNNKHGLDSYLITTSKRLILAMTIDSWMKDPIWESNKRKNFQSILFFLIVTKSKGLNDRQAWYIFQASNKPKTHAQLKYFVAGQSLFENLPKKQVQLNHPPPPHPLETFCFHNTQP